MKKLAVLVIILSIAFVSCDAFKDSYDAASVPEVEGGPGENVTAGGSVGDVLVCEALKEVTATVAKESGVVTSTVVNTAEDASKVKTAVEKLSEDTNKITVSEGDQEIVSFVLKKTDDKEFSVCSVTAEGLKIKSGSITVDSFNVTDKEDDKKIVNAGSFEFEFTKDEKAESTPVKTMVTMATGSAKEDTSIEGTYYSDALAGATK